MYIYIHGYSRIILKQIRCTKSVPIISMFNVHVVILIKSRSQNLIKRALA